MGYFEFQQIQMNRGPTFRRNTFIWMMPLMRIIEQEDWWTCANCIHNINEQSGLHQINNFRKTTESSDMWMQELNIENDLNIVRSGWKASYLLNCFMPSRIAAIGFLPKDCKAVVWGRLIIDNVRPNEWLWRIQFEYRRNNFKYLFFGSKNCRIAMFSTMNL